MKKIFKFLATEIIYNGHLQALGAVGIVYISSSLAFAKNAGLDLLVLVYLVFQFIYYFDRFHDVAIDEATNKERSTHIKKYLGKIPFIMGIILFLVVLGNLLFGNMLSLASSLFVMFLGAMYPVYFKGLTKKIFMFKNIYVSSVHALLVFYPLVYYSQNPTNSAVLYILFAFVLAEVAIMQIALDCKDIASDKKERLKTFPVAFGKDKSVLTMQILSLFSLLLFLVLGISFKLKPMYFGLLVSSFLINLFMAKKVDKSQKIGYLTAAAKFSLWLGVALVLNIII